MIKLFENIHSLITGSRRNSNSVSEFLTIGENVFVVAHSPQEMSAAMKMKNAKISGYIFSQRTLPQLEEQLMATAVGE